MTTLEFSVDQRHADVAGNAAKAMRHISGEELTAIHDATHNRKRDASADVVVQDRLRSIVERIERLEEERKTLGGDIKDIYVEAKSAGLDPKVLRQLIAIRKKEAAEVEEAETLLDIYRRALGM
jgi:uncharacterized protein (UPF0335 family)